MSYTDDYEYDDDEEYYEDEEDFIDYDEDDDDSKGAGKSSVRSAISPFPGSTTRPGGGLPGSGSSSRFGGGLGAGRPGTPSRIGARSSSDDDDEDESLASRLGGTSPSRFGSSSSPFGVRSPVPRDDDEDDDDEDESLGSRLGGTSPSRFGGSSSTPAGGSRFSGTPGGTTFSRPAGGDDKKDDSGTSRFGGTSPSRFGGSSSSSSTSSFSRPAGGDDKKDDKKPGTGPLPNRFGGSSSSSSTPTTPAGGSRFGGSSSSSTTSSPAGSGSRFSGSSSSSTSSFSRPAGGDDKKDDKKPGTGPLSNRFGAQSADKKDDKKDDKSSGGGLLGGITGRLGGGQSTDKKDDKSSGGGMLGGITGRLGGGQSADKKADKKDDKSSGGVGAAAAGVLGGLAGRFGSGQSADKKADKKDDKSSGGGMLGGLAGRFGSGQSADKKEEPGKTAFGSRGGTQPGKDSSSTAGKFSPAGKAAGSKTEPKDSGGSRFGALGGFGRGKQDDKAADNKKGKTAAASKEGESGGIFGRMTAGIGGIFGRGKAEDKSRRRQPKPAISRVPQTSDDGLTLDNWLDIIGVGLVFGALVLFFSAISAEQAAIASVHRFIGQLFGWGALAVPIAMFLIGMWLIIRHFGENAPTVDPVRVVGVVLLFVALLVMFQYVDSFSYDNIILEDGATTQALLQARLDYAWSELRAGGGVIGARLYYLLVVNVTEAGAVLLVLFVMFVGGMFVTRQSAAELVRATVGMWRSFREWMQMRAMEQRVERQRARLAAEERRAQQMQQMQMAQMAQASAATAPMMQQEVAAPLSQAAMQNNREIRFSLGGQVSTITPDQTGQPAQASQPAQSIGQMAATPPPATTESRSGVLGRFRGGNQSGAAIPLGGLVGSLMNRNNQDTAGAPPPPPLDSPLPMDDPVMPVSQPAATMPPVQSPVPTPAPAQPLFSQPPAPAEAATAQPQPTFGGTSESHAAPAAAMNNGAAEVEEELDPVAKARQDRLNALRRGETGPLSPGTINAARREEAEKAAYVPSSEGERERSFSEIMASAATPAVPAASAASEKPQKFTPPSQLPSVQPTQEAFQQSLEQPVSSEVKNQSRPRPQWRVPDFRTLLSSGSEQELDKEFLLKQAKIIENTLREFGSPGRVVEINTGPVITQFGVEPDYQMGRGGKKQRVKVSAIAALDKDLQLALGARSIRVEAPVPGKGYVGIEVPNAESTLVSLRDVMDSPGFNKYKSPLAIALGQSVSGAPISADLSSMPHLLIAGTTGSGKSVCVNSIIASVISRNTPDIVKFIMVDPKRVELTGYNGIPHLVAPVVVELERIVGVLKWVTREMDERYRRFSDAGARNIEDFNKHRDPATEPMPYIIVIIDELADLMMLAPEETERTITRIAALARATGIHLVIATQRPSVDVVTGLIKANFPARIAFAVAGSVDSRVILDQPGAERLLGKGDMLYLSGDSPAPLRLQGVYVSDMEINNIVRYWKMQALQQPDGASVMTNAPRFATTEAPKDVKPRTGDRVRQQAFWDSGESLPSFATGKGRSAATLDDDDDYDDDDYDDDDFDAELTDDELSGDVGDGHEDDLYEKSVELVRRLDKASISLLQRRLRIGYTRAARLIDVMEARGVVGPAKEGSSKPRDVLPT